MVEDWDIHDFYLDRELNAGLRKYTVMKLYQLVSRNNNRAICPNKCLYKTNVWAYL